MYKLQIYGLPANNEGSEPITFFRSFLLKLLDLPLTSTLSIQIAHRLGPKLAHKSISVIILFLEHVDLLKVLDAFKIKKQVI